MFMLIIGRYQDVYYDVRVYARRSVRGSIVESMSKHS